MRLANYVFVCKHIETKLFLIQASLKIKEALYCLSDQRALSEPEKDF